MPFITTTMPDNVFFLASLAAGPVAGVVGAHAVLGVDALSVEMR